MCLGSSPAPASTLSPPPPARQHLASDCVRPTWLPGPFPLRPRPAARALRRAGGGGFHAEHCPPAHPQHRVPVSCPQGDLVMPLAKQGDSGLDGQPGVGSVSLEDSRAKGEPKDRAPGPPKEELAGRLGLVPWGTGKGSQGKPCHPALVSTGHESEAAATLRHRAASIQPHRPPLSYHPGPAPRQPPEGEAAAVTGHGWGWAALLHL